MIERELTQEEITEAMPEFRMAQSATEQHLGAKIEMRCWENLETNTYRWEFSIDGHPEHAEHVLERLAHAAAMTGLEFRSWWE